MDVFTCQHCDALPEPIAGSAMFSVRPGASCEVLIAQTQGRWPTNRPHFQTRRPRSHSRSGPHSGGGLDKLNLDRKRAVIDVLLRVTILPGRRRAKSCVPSWCRLRGRGLKMFALKVIWFIVLMSFTLVVAALAGWLVAGIACVLARAVLLAYAEIPQLATTVGGVGNFPSSTPTSTLTDAEIATLEAEAAVP